MKAYKAILVNVKLLHSSAPYNYFSIHASQI